MQKQFDTVIFDLDGTLLDTLEDLHRSVNWALSQHGYPVRTKQEVCSFIGDGAGVLIARALPATCDAQVHAAVLRDFASFYTEHMQEHTRPYDGIVPLLEALATRNIKMAVVSNKLDAAVGPLVQRWFGTWISVAVGEGNGIPKKPAPEGVQKAMSLLGSSAERTLYVGDSDVDVQTAQNANIALVSCAWGFRDRSVLEEAGAPWIIDHPEELLARLG